MAAYLENLLISSSWPRDSLSRVLIIYINHTLPLHCLCGAPAFGVITWKGGEKLLTVCRLLITDDSPAAQSLLNGISGSGGQKHYFRTA